MLTMVCRELKAVGLAGLFSVITLAEMLGRLDDEMLIIQRSLVWVIHWPSSFPLS